MQKIRILCLVILIWILVGKLSIVEAQIVRDEKATTYEMLKKLSFLKLYYGTFIGAMIVFFLIEFVVENGFIYNKSFEIHDDDNPPQELNKGLYHLTIFVDIIIIIFFLIFLVNVII